MYLATVPRLLVYIFMLLIVMPSLVFAQSTVNLTPGEASMDEATQGSGGFIVTRDDAGNKNAAILVFVDYAGSATFNTDFTSTNLTGYAPNTYWVQIPAGQNSAGVVLTPIKDFVIEGDESLKFTLAAAVTVHGDYTVGAQTTAEMTILDLVDIIFLDSFEDRETLTNN